MTTHLNTHFPNFASTSPNFARIPSINETRIKTGQGVSLSNEEVEQRLAGVPIYALSNSSEEFVLVSGAKTGRSLGLFCFKKEDVDSLLDQMRSMDPAMRRGSRVVPVALNKVFQLKVNGVAFRLIPEATQINNASLQSLRVTGVENDEAFDVIAQFAGSLESLTLRRSKMSGSTVEKLASKFTSLKYLDLCYCYEISTRSILHILSCCPELEYLDVGWCWMVHLDPGFFYRRSILSSISCIQ